MTVFGIILWVLALFIGLPIIAYLVSKFATTGHLRAKERQRKIEERKKL